MHSPSKFLYFSIMHDSPSFHEGAIRADASMGVSVPSLHPHSTPCRHPLVGERGGATHGSATSILAINFALFALLCFSASPVSAQMKIGSNPTSITAATNLEIEGTGGVKTVFLQNGNVGIGTVAPTALLHFKAGTATASTAPLKFTSGTLLTAPEAGAVEFLTDAYYGTITTGAARKTFAFLESPSFTTPTLGVATATSLAVPTLTSSSGPMTMTPAAGSNFNLVLSTTGDFAVNTNQLYVDTSTANVGIGTVAPTALLHFKAGTATASTAPLKFTSGTLLTAPEAGAVEFLTDAYYGTITTGAARKTFAFLESPSFTTPTLGVATATSLAVPTLTSSSGPMTMTPAAGSNFNLVLSTTGDFAVNTNQLYVDTSTANVGIGTTSPAAKLDVTAGGTLMAHRAISTSATGYAGLMHNTASNYYCYFGYLNTYSIICSGPTSLPSDMRLKKDITSLAQSSGLSAIMGLRPISYTWKDTKKGDRVEYGFIAQEVEQVFPNLVGTLAPTTDEEKAQTGGAPMKTLQYEGFIAPLVKSVQELKAENDALKARLDRLESLLENK